MPEPESGKYPRKVGRPHKPPSGDDPLAALARELVALKLACGDPSYKALAESSGVYATALVEAGRGVKLREWDVIQGYVQGCWAYRERTRQNPIEGSGDWSRWEQLYRDAGGIPPGECPPQPVGEGQAAPSSATVTSAAATNAAVTSRLAHIQRALPADGGIRPVRLAIGIAATVALVIGGAAIGLSLTSRKPPPAAGSPTAPEAPKGQDSTIAVVAPGLSCGHPAPDGFRSPATTTFRGIKTVSVVSLEGMSVSVMQGTYNGTTYDWAESHPTGSRAGIQLRWANAPHEWHYCTVTVESGNVTALPGEFATIAVPETVSDQRVIYQACIWHQHPFTEQCSSLF